MKLIAIQEEEGSDYINASYLDVRQLLDCHHGARGMHYTVLVFCKSGPGHPMESSYPLRQDFTFFLTQGYNKPKAYIGAQGKRAGYCASKTTLYTSLIYDSQVHCQILSVTFGEWFGKNVCQQLLCSLVVTKEGYAHAC